ncbi:formate dehydrogenase subunit gamma [Phosphitispora sp. TUW77]|uniref:formate dehydrogenase subunit gamma n=1 Tax=Phosphitispora sp. TUW77 TaxID=3152361 RepID=UPI003AB2F085
MAGKNVGQKKSSILRHTLTVRMIHWMVTISTFILIFTGFGQMPIYKRYLLDQVPGFAWSSNYEVTVFVHYSAAIVLVFAAVFHLIYHGMCRHFNLLPRRGDLRESYLLVKAMLTKGKEPPCHKYLPEQRLAYFFVAGSLGMIIITGIFKVLKNLPSMANIFSNEFIYWMTLFHNIATVMVVFGIIAHLGAFLFKENRALLPSIFTGRADLEYIKHRHSLWYDELYSQNIICSDRQSCREN